MSFGEKANANAQAGATIGRNSGMSEQANAQGFYTVECRDANGNLKWSDVIQNVVCTGGKNYALDNFLAGSAYTAAWYLGLISLTSYSAVAAADTMASHAGWLEAGGANAPTYTGARGTVAWTSASSGAKASNAVSFLMTGAGTVKGCFLTTISTKDGTTGTLYSAGLFSGGDKTVANNDTLAVTYTASL